MPELSTEFYAGAILALVTLAIGVGVTLGMDAKTRGEYRFAVGCFVLSFLIASCMVGMWDVKTEDYLVKRIAISGILFFLIGVSLTETVRWVHSRHKHATASTVTKNAPAEQIPTPIPSPVPTLHLLPSLKTRALQLSKELSTFVEMRSYNRPVLTVPVMPDPEQQREMYEFKQQFYQKSLAQFNADLRAYYSEHFADRVTKITLELKSQGVYVGRDDSCRNPLFLEVYQLCAEQIKQAALKLPSEHSEVIPPSKPTIEYVAVADHTEASLTVTNIGTIADVWASLRIDGFVSGKRNDIFGRWAHTNSSKTRIARGQSCKLLLAMRKSDPNFVTVKWSIPYSEENSTGGTSESFYASMIGNKDAQADDIHLYVCLFSDPDCQQEVKQCHIVLHALRAEELSS
jgi:hypothetical protein